MLLASGLLALVVAIAFAVLLSAVLDLRRLEREARRAENVLVVANRLERLIVDAESGQRGYLLTGQEEFLQQWQAAQAAFPGESATLTRLLAGNAEQAARAERLSQAMTSYLQDYSIPLVQAARRDLAAARSVAATEEGERRVDAMRAEFDSLVSAENGFATARERSADTAATRAVLAAAGGLAGSVLLIAAFAGYLNGAIVRPVRRTARMAQRLAGGDLAARVPERGVGEIGVLATSFNTMAGSLQNSRQELAASRVRIVAAADQARRRIERDLHDGIQQRLVSMLLEVRANEATLPPDLRDQFADGLAAALDEVRELSRGIHPAILTEGGLRPALKALARRSAVPVEAGIDVPGRLPETVEVGAYYVVSEALANASKHARATLVNVEARVSAGVLRVCVRDDGVGGARPGTGSGLVGLTDRVQALGGTLTITSAAGEGTTLCADLPVEGPPT
jgi:signal transduction histidine kinase